MSTIRIASKAGSKARLRLPGKLRYKMQISTGDTLSLKCEPGSGIMGLTKATTPLDILADEAQKGFQVGKTVDFREYARGNPKVSDPHPGYMRWSRIPALLGR